MDNLAELVSRSAQRFANALALKSAGAGSGISFAQLEMLQKRGAAVLRASGLVAGERVLLFMEPCPEWAVAFFAILEAGLVVVPVPAQAPPAAVAGMATFADARLAIVSQRTQTIAPLLANNPCLDVEYLLGNPHPQPLSQGERGESLLPHPQPLSQRERGEGLPIADSRQPTADSRQLALLAFTSGSTSRPRAVELTHANLVANLQGLLQVRQAGPGDVFLSMLPPAHLFELMVGQLGPLACGACVVYAGSLLPNRLLAALRQEKVTHALAVPALLDALYDQVLEELAEAKVIEPGTRNQSPAETARRLRQDWGKPVLEEIRAGVREAIGPSFHTLVVGGAAMDPAWVDIAAALGWLLEVGYGLTEASPIVCVAQADSCPAGSVGRPLPGVEVRVDDQQEILVRGPNVMRAYWKDPQTTTEVLQDGWLRTGDRGYLDQEGHLFVTGRLKEAMVTAGGETIYPEEIEPYYSSPHFAEYCVTAMPGPQGNDVPTLFVVPAAAEMDDQELEQIFAQLRAAAPARLRVQRLIRRSEPLPRTATGKVRRRLLASG